MKKSFKLFGLALGLLACESDNVKPIEQELPGEWSWVETTYVNRGTDPVQTYTPATTDTAMLVRVNASSIELIKNDSLYGEFEYTLIKSDLVYMSIDYRKYTGSLKMEEGPVRLENGQLLISGGHDDAGGTQVFERIK